MGTDDPGGGRSQERQEIECGDLCTKSLVNDGLLCSIIKVIHLTILTTFWMRQEK